MTNDEIKRFFDKIKKTENCWLWTASLRAGYGAFRVDGKLESAHRISYNFHNGFIEEGLVVSHTCDNKKCVNPKHLVLRTYQENTMEHLRKGHHVIPTGGGFKKGGKPANRKLDDKLVRSIKNDIENKNYTNLKNLAEKYNIKYYTIIDIKKNKSYKSN